MTESTLLTRVSGSGPVRRLEIKLEIDSPIQKVWSALTDSNKVQNWWTAGIIEPREGGRFILDDGNEVNGTVKMCYPPYIFEFTWNDHPDNAGHPHLIDIHTKSTVRFDLTELENDRSSLTFIQYLPPDEVVGASAGWHQIVGERLKYFVETGSASDEPERFAELKKVYAASGIS